MSEHVSTAFGRGGRTGEVWSETGSFRLATTLPGLSRAGATAEELIAAAWTACFGTTFAGVAEKRGIPHSDAEFRADVTLDANPREGVYTISRAALSVAIACDPGQLEAALAEAHAACPVSKLLSAGTSEVTVSAAPA